MRIVFHSLLVSSILASVLIAQDGTYDFLRLDASARIAAMGGSFVSMKDDPNVIFYNPASLATMTLPQISFSYLDHLMDVNAGTASFAQPVEGIGSIGAGITYIDYGSFAGTDASGNTTGTFSAQELALVAGIATAVEENTYIGGNIKYIYSSISEYRSSAIAIDAGVLYEIPSQNITLGASILSLGKQLKTYDGVQESLPLDFTIGITKKPEHLPAYINLNFHKLNQTVDKFSDRFRSFTIGIEFLASTSLRLRAGYNNEQNKDLATGTNAGLSGFSFGAGLLVRSYRIDYAYSSYGKIGGLNRFSIAINL
jgi:hypothetical protein